MEEQIIQRFDKFETEFKNIKMFEERINNMILHWECMKEEIRNEGEGILDRRIKRKKN